MSENWYVKAARAQTENDFETWKRGGVSPTLNAMDNGSESRATVLAVLGDVTHTLTHEGHDASEDGTGRGTPIIAATNDSAPVVTQDYVGALKIGTGLDIPSAPSVLQPVAFTASEQANSYAWESPINPTLNAQVPNDTSNIQYGVRDGAQVRRLTPRECERLQGFPLVIRTIELELRCSDLLQSDAPAEMRSRRSPRSASVADASDLRPSVRSVVTVTYTPPADHDSPAPELARIDCEPNAAPLLSLGRSSTPANGAEPSEVSVLPAHIADSVRLLADTYSTLENATLAGAVESRGSGIASTHHLSGRLLVELSGCATMPDVLAAVSDMSTMADLLTKCITSRSGSIDPTSGLTLATSLCSVLNATTGCIPAPTPLPTSWRITLTSADDWTAGQADSARYRQMGNAVAVPVVEWIMRRLVAVDEADDA